VDPAPATLGPPGEAAGWRSAQPHPEPGVLSKGWLRRRDHRWAPVRGDPGWKFAFRRCSCTGRILGFDITRDPPPHLGDRAACSGNVRVTCQTRRGHDSVTPGLSICTNALLVLQMSLPLRRLLERESRNRSWRSILVETTAEALCTSALFENARAAHCVALCGGRYKSLRGRCTPPDSAI
jgi:hypothetical protein